MIELRALGEAELEAIAPLFEHAFGYPASPALLRWKYAQGRGESWTAWEDGKLSLHIGAMFRQVALAGESIAGAQMMDLMALPKAAPLRRAASPFAQLMRHLLTQRLPRPGCPHRLVFGVSCYRARRLQEQLGLGRSAGKMSNLVLTPAAAAGLRWVELAADSPAWRPAANACWQAMAADLRHLAVGVRDADYYAHRFFAHPHCRYTVLLVQSRWLRRTLGLAVLRSHGNTTELLDVLAPLKNHEPVLAGVRAWLAGSGHAAASYLVSQAICAYLAPWADRVEPSEFHIMLNAYAAQRVHDRASERWWLTGGDTEYR